MWSDAWPWGMLAVMEQANAPRQRSPRTWGAQAHPPLVRRLELVDIDVNADRMLNRQVRERSLVRLRPGRFASRQDLAAVEAEVRHRMQVQACLELCQPGTVVSHVSAAVLHGIEIWNLSLDRVHVTRSRPNSGHISRDTHLHCSHLDSTGIVVLHGLKVTSAARTVVDIACTAGFEEAVVVADCALNMQLVTLSELQQVADSVGRRRGIARARRVLAFADARSESVGETRGRVFMVRHRLPTPVLQFEVRNSANAVIATCDFALPELGWVGEFDGRVKFGRLLKEGETAGDAAFREKRRQDLICDEDLVMLRWTWADYHQPEALRRRFIESHQRAARRSPHRR